MSQTKMTFEEQHPLSIEYIDLGYGATAAFLSGERLHLQQGPINLVIKAYGASVSVAKAYDTMIANFPALLSSLVADLPLLKQLFVEKIVAVSDPTAKRMVSSVSPYVGEFITPMAAVAGSVADQVISWVHSVAGITKCFVNNGGDIAVYLADGESIDIGVVPSLVQAVPNAKISITSGAGVMGVATSGWDGHSHSFGIADAVTVLASNAAQADVAATMIANKVNVDHPSVHRKPAVELDEASDLGERLVTVSVAPLPEESRNLALTRGVDYAKHLLARGVINSALLSLQGDCRIVGDIDGTSLDQPSKHLSPTPLTSNLSC